MRKATAAFWAVLGLCLVTGAAHAAEAVKVLEVRWRGTQALEAAYPESPLGQAFSNAEPLDREQIMTAIEAFERLSDGDVDPQVMEAFEAGFGFLDAAWAGGVDVALFVDPNPAPDPAPFGGPGVRTGVVFEMPVTDATRPLLERPEVTENLAVTVNGDRMRLVSNRPGSFVPDYAFPEAPPLPLAGWVNVPALLDLATRNAPPDADRVLDALNLDALGPLTLGGDLTDAGWVTRLRLPVDPAKADTGLPTLFAGGDLDRSLLGRVPDGASRASLQHLSLPAVLTLVRDVAAAQDPTLVTRIDGGIDLAGQMIGVDLRADLFENLGNTWLRTHEPNAAGMSLLGTVIINKPKNAAGVQRVVDGVLRAYGTAMRQQQADFVPPVVRRELGEVQMTMLQGPGFSLVSVLQDGFWFLGFDERAVVAAAAGGRGRKPLAAVPQGEAARVIRAQASDDLGGKPLSLVSIDPRPGLASLYPTLDFFDGLLRGGAAGVAKQGVGAGLPSLTDLITPIPVSQASLVRDAEGLTLTWTSALPGVELAALDLNQLTPTSFLVGAVPAFFQTFVEEADPDAPPPVIFEPELKPQDAPPPPPPF